MDIRKSGFFTVQNLNSWARSIGITNDVMLVRAGVCDCGERIINAVCIWCARRLDSDLMLHTADGVMSPNQVDDLNELARHHAQRCRGEN
jgi:hypothetical protein